MFVIVLLVVFSVCIATGGGNVKVNFTSSPDPPNIAEGGTAVFNCSSNHSTVIIAWLLNTTSASTFISDGVIVNGAAGTIVSSLIIPGLVDPFNHTEVQCVAFGLGIGDFTPSPVILRVQGVPAPVDNNLTLSYDSCCYTFSWTAPFTLPGFPILNYNVSITNNGMIIDQTNVSVTQWTYCPPETGTHIISIAAVNEVGEGKINYLEFFVEETEIRDTKLMDQYIDFYQNQIISVKLDGNEKFSAKLKNCTIELIELKCTVSNATFNSSNITDDGLVTFNISDQSAADKFHNVTTQITLDSGLVVHSNSSNPLSLSFFDVSGYEVLSGVSTNVSFQCTFLNGSKAAGCCIIMEEMKTGKNYSLDITRLTRENITVTGRVEDFVETGSYIILIYDINFDGNQASNPAYSTTIVVTSGTSTPTASSSPAVVTSPTSMLSASPTSTTGEASNDNNGVIAVVIGSIFGIFFGIILIIIVLVALACWKHKAHTKEFEIGASPSVNENRQAEQKNTVNYIDIELPNSNVPANPPSLEISKTVYSTILPVNNQAQYDEEYSQTGSMLYDTVTDRPI